MKIIELIKHYDRSKSVHAPLGDSLSSKLVQLMDLFGQLDSSTPGKDLAEHCLRRMPGAAPGTVLRVLSQLRAVLRVASRDGLIHGAQHIPMPAVYDVVDCPITPAECNLLLEHMKWTAPRWWPLTAMLANTGARLGEALRSRPTDLRADAFVIRKEVARRSKTVARVIPIRGEFSATVANCCSTNVAKGYSLCWLTPPEYGTPRSVAAGLGRAIKDACNELGLPPIRVNDLRHVFAARVAERGGDIADIATLLGHSKIQTSMRYRGLVKTRARELLCV